MSAKTSTFQPTFILRFLEGGSVIFLKQRTFAFLFIIGRH